MGHYGMEPVHISEPYTVFLSPRFLRSLSALCFPRHSGILLFSISVDALIHFLQDSVGHLPHQSLRQLLSELYL